VLNAKQHPSPSSMATNCRRLLIEHEIGIRKRLAQLYELHEDFFKPDDQTEPVE